MCNYAFQSAFFGTVARSSSKRMTSTLPIPQLAGRCSRKAQVRPICTIASLGGANAPNQCTRRTALRLIGLGVYAASYMRPQIVVAEQEYSTYKGPISLGFSFSYPSSWNVKKKPIKTHLSEVIITSDKDSSTTVGIVVDSVKINAIEEFGSPEAVGQKVVNVETKKESVNSANIMETNAVTKDGLTYYILDYIVDSSRGVKRYLAKATITGGQLYVLTAQAKTDGFEGDTQDILKTMIESFAVAKQYL